MNFIEAFMKLRVATLAAALGAFAISASMSTVYADDGAWSQKTAPLMTRWAKEVTPNNALPEYPRPQLVRSNWMNLNGLWNYSVLSKDDAQPSSFQGQILVPYPIESALSGVMRMVNEKEQIWYQRTFTIPQDWQGNDVILHFGASDWETTVFVNGNKVGTHKGGYTGFCMDITKALKESGDQQIVVSVWDPTSSSTQPRGKQISNPHGIWYTPTSGIWQTVWLEPVPKTHIKNIKITPEVDTKSAVIGVDSVFATKDPVDVNIEVLDEGKVVSKTQVQVLDGSALKLNMRVTLDDPKLWTPDTPFLYDLKISLTQDGKEIDTVNSYFGMRKIAIGKDKYGVNRLMLNNEPLFQFGPLDQGFWPDGIYTAPTDEALKYDLQVIKDLGFNMARKHVKVEPDRWYYHCDKMGVLVWQDMPSGDKYIGTNDPDVIRTKASADQYESELKELVEEFYNHPCIVMWVPFNEGWGQFDTARIVNQIKIWDSSRLVDNTSGWSDRKVGDVMDIHVYPGPGVPDLEANRAGVLGEYGGLGYPIKDHLWKKDGNWGYVSYSNADDLTEHYVTLIDKMYPLSGRKGLSAAVYTQITDVEIEVNGIMTYDREIIKMDVETLARNNKRMYKAPVARQAQGDDLVPPSTPLVAHDPYFSLWSPGDKLNEVTTTHWTGREKPMNSIIRIDGKAYRLMGIQPHILPALEQKSLNVYPTRTVYEFSGAGIGVTLTFTSPILPDDLMILTRPVTYLTWDIKSIDGKAHDVDLYFDASSNLVVNDNAQKVVWERSDFDGMNILKIGTEEQPYLEKKGDNVCIDWGYLYLGTDSSFNPCSTIAEGKIARAQFVKEGTLPEMDNTQPRAVSDKTPVLAYSFKCGNITEKQVVLGIGYDDIYSIRFLDKDLRAYWRKDGAEAKDIMVAARTDYLDLAARCKAFDEELMADLTAEGGIKYAKIAALAYRQSYAACKVVADDNGQPLMFSKENFSNGCIATVDVFYPQSPMLIFLNPSLIKATVMPMLEYANSSNWRFRFAPHDIGTYPQANGQICGGGEKTEENQMPVEETANMLILLSAICEIDGSADFVAPFWPLIVRWADFLREKGYDPENQLCTDDFAGHLAHNTNLSIKAIVALGGFAKMSEMKGEKIAADLYAKIAQEYAERWVREARDGDHFRLTFDKEKTWSMKYNLVWDKILNLNLFPDSVAQTEMAFYKKVQKTYGLPLDNRHDQTKLDWILWTACLTGQRADFDTLVAPVFRFLNCAPNRVPMCDWYSAQDAKQRGFQARPVVGGVFIKMLCNREIWNKWVKRDGLIPTNWAPAPKRPSYIRTVIIPTAETEQLEWRYTFDKPADNWFATDFDCSSWKVGKAGFGTEGTPGAIIGTKWDKSDIWIIREFNLDEIPDSLALRIYHDENAEIYVNGELIATYSGYSTYRDTLLKADKAKAFKVGKNVMAVHCHQTTGGQCIDVGVQNLRLLED